VQTPEKPKSISQLAKELNRHQEAISRDISHLKKLGLVILKRFKQTIYALPVYSCIDIRLCNSKFLAI
jgi:predicted transcriptional regulator